MPKSSLTVDGGKDKSAGDPEFPVLKPSGQIDFYSRLQTVRKRYLHEALKGTVEDRTFELEKLDRELAAFVDAKHLKQLAASGIRGEVFFSVPYLLYRNPCLLGYYRLLYGFSCKAFYEQGPFKLYRLLENTGELPPRIKAQIPMLCRSLAKTGGMLLDSIQPISLSVVNDLQILTLGAQFRGSGNVKVGQDAIDNFFNLCEVLLCAYNPKIKGRRISFHNDSKVPVVIRFGSDPDVSVTQTLESEERKLVAIELKGGADVSNIWNRLGEAEKSHLKAKAKGFNELWTVTRVDLNVDPGTVKKAKEQSPSTTRFFLLDRIVDHGTTEAIAFRQVFGSIMGVRFAL